MMGHSSLCRSLALSFALLLAFLFSSIQAQAMVDMRNANFSESWIDMQIKGASYDLRVHRTYNSRTLFSGVFGFGWCTEFETTLKVTSENSFRVTECGAGYEIEFYPKTGTKNIDSHVRTLMTEYRARNKGRTEAQYKGIEKDLRADSALREEFARQFNITGKVLPNTSYVASGRSGDVIIFKNNEYVRNLPNGTTQKFNKDGRLIHVADQNGNFIRLQYAGDKMVSVTESGTISLQFKYYDNSKLVKQVIGPNNLTATYTYKGENLVSMKNAWGNTYSYEYDELYNMTLAKYPDSTTVKITYDKDKDWVMQYKDRMGCTESYKYTDDSKDPENNYKSEVKKVCNGKVTNVSSYEFWHRIRKDGVRYLERTLAVNNGQVVDTTYHEIFGRPVILKQNNEVTRFDYNSQGQIVRKSTQYAVHTFKYNDACNKVAQVTVEDLSAATRSTAASSKQRKPTSGKRQLQTTQFLYDTKRCNLMAAKNTSGQSVQLAYDMKGRITKILDQSKKMVTITYEERFGKPHVVNRPGLGSIRFQYKEDGSVDKFDSPDAPIVAMQVATIFSNLLEIIAPATTDTNTI